MLSFSPFDYYSKQDSWNISVKISIQKVGVKPAPLIFSSFFRLPLCFCACQRTAPQYDSWLLQDPSFKQSNWPYWPGASRTWYLQKHGYLYYKTRPTKYGQSSVSLKAWNLIFSRHFSTLAWLPLIGLLLTYSSLMRSII